MLNLPFRYYVFVCIPPGKAVPEMTYTVSNLTYCQYVCAFVPVCGFGAFLSVCVCGLLQISALPPMVKEVRAHIITLHSCLFCMVLVIN